MALGIALLFNIKLPQNFNSPYKAKNIQDFWRRWHITLSRFLRDYIYIPLGGNKKGNFQTYNNLFITFLIGGIWHGAAWTFVIWGTLHGVAIVFHRIWHNSGIKINNILAVIATFLFVNFAWVFFRAAHFSDAIKVINGMFGFSGFIVPRTNKLFFKFSDDLWVNWLLILVSIIIIFVLKNSSEFAQKFKPSVTYLLMTILLGYLAIINMSKISEFLYFQF
jgi:D-alanyl-lipoteichoic acid acyltransferase DltB (MBOAT superfamily)